MAADAMSFETLNRAPHRRLNPLTGEWVLVSPQRAERPWQGQVEKNVTTSVGNSYDASCYLCPGNARARGARNPDYTSTFVFDNDFPALVPDGPPANLDAHHKGLLVAGREPGICRVICFAPRHDLTLAQMTVADIGTVIDQFATEFQELGSLPNINYVQIFENRGEMMGCSNPHPHGQIWASHTIPNEPRKELLSQRAYAQSHKGCLLCDYLQLEIAAKERIVCENAYFTALVPFWAIWPFEILLLAKNHARDLLALDKDGRADMADILKRITTRYDNLFATPFPYSMGFHQAPTDGEAHPEWHLHAHFYPPLLRSAQIRKFMVGYEMLATPQRDITPESAASTLRGMSERHYTVAGG